MRPEAQRYFDHLEVDDLEASLGLVPDLDAAIPGSKRAFASGERAGGGAPTQVRLTRGVVETKGIEPSTSALRKGRQARDRMATERDTGGGELRRAVPRRAPRPDATIRARRGRKGAIPGA